MAGDDTAIGGPHGRFPSTQVSLLESARGEFADEARERIIGLYWKPVYCFIRFRFRKSNEDAKDLTQSFFISALERHFFARFEPEKASFRTFLRMAVERFVINQDQAAGRQKRGGEVAIEPLEDQDIAGDTPESIFEREWRRQLFALAIDDLRTHCEAAGRNVHFQVFEAYDLADDPRVSYAELAARHGITESAVTNYLAWARRMLRQMVHERLRGTTSNERELRTEERTLWS